MSDNDVSARDAAQRGGFRWRPRQVLGLVKATVKEFGEDKVPKQAAALAYYTLFALGPLLVVCILIAGFVFGADAARAAVMGQFSRLLGDAGSQAIGDMLTGSASRGSGSGIAALVGIVVLLFGAIGVFAQIKESLNTIWEVETKPKTTFWAKIWALARNNLLSFAGLLGAAFLLTVSLVLSAGITAFGNVLGRAVPGGSVVLLAMNFLVGVLVLWGVFSLLYKLVPEAKVAWRDVAVGALVTAVFFSVGQILLGIYLGHSAFATKYGAGGAVLLVLVWVYYSGIILFFGAELTQVYANQFGSHVKPNRRARTLQEGILEEHDLPQREGTEEMPERKKRERGTT